MYFLGRESSESEIGPENVDTGKRLSRSALWPGNRPRPFFTLRIAGGDGFTVRGFKLNIPTLEDMTDSEAILWAANKCAAGVRWKASVQRFEIDKLRWAAGIQRETESLTFKGKGFVRFDLVERGKLRHIMAVHISERVVQKLLSQKVLRPVIEPRLVYYNTASQTGKGTELALKGHVEHLRWHFARYGRRGGILTMDLHDYFGSVPHKPLIDKFCCLLRDERLHYFVGFFINSFDGDTGIGLGSEISQDGAIFYPSDIDKMIQCRLGVHCYGRYNDDSYIIHPDIKYLERCRELIAEKYREHGIAMNPKKTVIRPLTDGWTFLKKRVYLKDTGKIVLRLTYDNIRAERRRIAHMRGEYDARRITDSSILQSYQAWRSYAGKYNSYRVIGEMDRYFAEKMKGVHFGL